MPTLDYPGIPEPMAEPEDLRAAVSLVKENVEVMQGKRGDTSLRVPTYKELVDLGVIAQVDFDRLARSHPCC